MRRIAGHTTLLAFCLAATLHAPAAIAAADCPPDLMASDAAPSLMAVRADAGRVHFVKDAATQAGCPGEAPFCLGAGFVLPGDPVIVSGGKGAYACATFTRAAKGAASSTGWLPRAALTPARVAPVAPVPAEWIGDWQAGPEQTIGIKAAPNGDIVLHGEASYGARDPKRVERGAVNTGSFDVSLPPMSGGLAFLIGADGKPAAFDAPRGKNESLCGLRLWRLGPYLVVGDNLQCGGMNVTFAGVYRRIGNP